MLVFLQIAYFALGIVQFFAVVDGVKYALDIESFIGGAFAFFVSMFLTYVPVLGSIIGVYGAVNVCDWSLTKSVLLFFLPIISVVAVSVIGYIADRR